MPEPQHLDPNSPFSNPFIKVASWVATLVTSALMWIFKTFQTRKSAEAMFVKKVESDGKRAYVHPEEWEEMKKRMDESIKQSAQWQAIARDWMNNP